MRAPPDPLPKPILDVKFAEWVRGRRQFRQPSARNLSRLTNQAVTKIGDSYKAQHDLKRE